MKERPTNPHISYVDDTTAFVTHSCPKQLLHEVDVTRVAMRTALARFGLHLNMGPQENRIDAYASGEEARKRRADL